MAGLGSALLAGKYSRHSHGEPTLGGIRGTFNVDVRTDVELVRGVRGCQAQEPGIVVVCFHPDTDAVELDAPAGGADQVSMREAARQDSKEQFGELGPRLWPPNPGPESDTNWKSRIRTPRTPVESSATHSAAMASRAASPESNRRACDFIAAALLVRYSFRLKEDNLRRNHQWMFCECQTRHCNDVACGFESTAYRPYEGGSRVPSGT